MPSSAYQNFSKNLIDVERLIESHQTLSGENPGKRGLGHITRSGVLMLCAAWEVYIEDLLIDSVEFLANSCEEAAKLPLAVKKHISRNVKAAKNELKPLGLAGHGWRLIYKEFAATAANNLNTPKSHNVDRLFQENVGIKNLSANWTYGAAEIDAFVAERGEIAHRGRSAQYIKAQKLQRYLDEIKRTATETDNFICQNLKELSPQGKQPWNRTSLD